MRVSLLRPVDLESLAPGRLFLSAMPGRTQPLAWFAEELVHAGVHQVVCLADLAASPEYAHAVATGAFPVPVRRFPIPDFGVPADEAGFASLVREIAGWLRAGQHVVLHCGAGIGRTGLTAIGVLMALGLSLAEAERRVVAAGSRVETPRQWEFVRRFAERVDIEGSP